MVMAAQCYTLGRGGCGGCNGGLVGVVAEARGGSAIGLRGAVMVCHNGMQECACRVQEHHVAGCNLEEREAGGYGQYGHGAGCHVQMFEGLQWLKERGMMTGWRHNTVVSGLGLQSATHGGVGLGTAECNPWWCRACLSSPSYLLSTLLRSCTSKSLYYLVSLVSYNSLV